MTIWFATGNAHKKIELEGILREHLGAESGWNLKLPLDAGLAFDPEETGGSFAENALIKARELFRLLCEKNIWQAGGAIIADDSGICVDALDGRPGIFSARYAGKDAPAGSVKLDSPERNALLLAELGDNPRRQARFVCAMVLLVSADRFFIAHETLEGTLVRDIKCQKGKGGFGYDPILYIPEEGKTVAELSKAEKNRLSHRGKAGRIISGVMRNL